MKKNKLNICYFSYYNLFKGEQKVCGIVNTAFNELRLTI